MLRFFLFTTIKSNVAATVIISCVLLQMARAGETAPASSLRVPPRELSDALNSFEVIDGFRMQLVAHEPNVLEPIVIAYDENGRMYVAEYLKFPAKGGISDGPDGRIRLLRDIDGNGDYEHSNVFATGLAWPTGICPWKGGVFVIAAPDLWYLKDTDSDGRADVRTKVFTGFGFNNEEGTANNLIWGLDNWIYGAGSNSGGQIKPADQPNARAISLLGRDFRFHPTTGKFEAISGSEQFGNTFDDWNNRFICQNSKPAVHVVLPARYLARNPYLPVPAVRRDIWKGDRVYRASPIEAWRLERTKMRLAEDRDYSAPSIAHDVFTACTGVAIYRGAAYPEKYRGNLFVADVQSNLIHRRLMQPNGVSFESLRADEETEMVRSQDNWFRPANLINAPDGTLHIVDMYREVIETPDSLPDEIIANIDLLSGNNRGRIYRLAPPGFKVPKPPQLEWASTEQLVRQLENPNGWWRDTAGRLLYERQDRRAIEPLRTLFHETKNDLAQLHAIHALESLSDLSANELEEALAAPSAGVREHAVRLAESRFEKNDLLLERVLALANDVNPRVRFQVALSLGEINDQRAAEALANIARRDAEDTWIQTAVLSSSLKLAAGMLETLLADSDIATTFGGRQFLRQLALVVGGRNQQSEVVSVLNLIETSPAAKRENVRRPIILGLGEGLRRSRSNLSQYVKDSPAAADLLSGLIENAKKTLANPSSNAQQREQAIEMLAHNNFDDVREMLVSMLDSRQAPTVQLAATRALTSFDKAEVSDALIDAWQGLSPPVRGEVVEALLGRRQWTGTLLDAIEGERISPAYIAPVRKTRLVKHSDAKIRARAVKLFGNATLNPRENVVDAYRSALALTGDAERGAKVFEQNCMTCHKVAGRGHDVGPNLATVQNRTPEALMIQILDPNREVLASYTQYVIVLNTGRIVSGLIAGESPSSIRLKRAENVMETILRQNIDEIVGSGKSLMPEGLEQQINKQQMSDLMAYLTEAG
ncbi:MAG: PVC-type heme-binding CxxCH protein [Aeoliella sp.]